jgi:hypothetical protein
MLGAEDTKLNVVSAPPKVNFSKSGINAYRAKLREYRRYQTIGNIFILKSTRNVTKCSDAQSECLQKKKK